MKTQTSILLWWMYGGPGIREHFLEEEAILVPVLRE